MYRVLYRKWRPKIFDDVTGQPQVTLTLKNQISHNRFGHAYLFTGSRGTGKTTCAKIFAKAVNCLSPENGNPCGKCENCLNAEASNLLDIVEMDAASNRGIDSIRSLIDEAVLPPYMGKFRVYIIDEVHMLTVEAFNSLLKTLEEPPPHVVFILATTDVDRLPATVLSRCQRFDFNRISPEDISKRLEYIAENEDFTLSADAAMLIAALADGALRDALSLLDRCAGLSSDITEDIVRKASGLTGKDYIFSLINCAINKNCAAALETVDRLYRDSKSMSALCSELITQLRHLMLIKTLKNPRLAVIVPQDDYDKMCEQAAFIELSDIISYMDTLSTAFEKMSRGCNNRIELETALVKLCSPELDFSKEALLSRLSSLERAVKSGVVIKAEQPKPQDFVQKTEEEPAEQELATAENAQVKSAFTAMDAVIRPEVKAQPMNGEQISQAVRTRKAPDLEQLRAQAEPFPRWPEVIEEIDKYSKAVASALKGSKAYTSGNYLLIDTDNRLTYDLLRNSSQKDNIRRAVFEITGKKYSMGPYKKLEEAALDPLSDFLNGIKDKGITVEEL